MRNPALAVIHPAVHPVGLGRRSPAELSEIIATAAGTVRDAAHPSTLVLEEVARWCVEVGGVDPRLELAALRHAREVIAIDALVDDVIATLRARLIAAGDLFPTLVARGGIPRVLAALGLDDVDPPPHATLRPLPPRIARFYWQRLRAFVAWSAACAWPS